jgi:ornithine cyclodeaminase/alanine dehydrogenase-like protein (mu-crystallin family)
VSFSSVPLLDDRDVRSAVTHRDAIEVIESVYADYGRAGAVLSIPPAMLMKPLKPGSAAFKVKGGHVPSRGISGFRMIADRDIDGRESTIDCCWIADAETGRLLGLVHETWLHRLRTAMTSVVAMKWLARTDSRIAVIVGAGQIAEEIPAGLAALFDLAELRIVSRQFETAVAFAQRHRGLFHVRPFPSVEAAMEGADIVITSSSSDKALVHGSFLRPGMTVCSLGAGPELGVDVVTRADRLVVDDFEYACTIGSIRGWLAAGIERDELRQRICANIGEVALDRRIGRRSPDEIVVAVIQGMACCDVALAFRVLERATARSSFVTR